MFPKLFADQHAIRNVMRGMHHRQAEFDTSGLATALLFFCLFFVSVWGISRLFLKPAIGETKNDPLRLFAELCRAHQLGFRDWWFLRRLAHYHRLANPALLFLQPHHLDPALCGEVWKAQAPRLRELQLKLFAGLASPYPGERSGTQQRA
ncbi:MAG TPA: hypothetical protein VG125_24570 [Pirellulales bacterium]|jgi:hypothetical protein|nr:hypothetical protein [Pirellulales bacterium]